MPLILAIEPDSRQASLLSDLARGLADAEFALTTSAREALEAFDTRVPDLILTSTLLSPADEAMLTERLRDLDSAGAHVQTLVIPVLAEPQPEPQPQGGLLSRLWRKPKGSSPDGCDPAVFAGQISEYLNRAHVLRRAFTSLPPSTLEKEKRPARPDPEPVAEASPTPLGPSYLAPDPEPTLGLFKPEEPPAADEPVLNEQVLGIPRPRWAEPLVTDLEALGAELDAVLSAHAVTAEPSAHPAEAAPAGAVEDVAEAESPVEEPAAIEEPVAVAPPFRTDLLEILAAIQLDLEPLRSAPGEVPPAPVKPAEVQDEWGFFDPQQCGMAALLARLEEIAEQREARTGPR
jgi:CheY-like chemotaxis protein